MTTQPPQSPDGFIQDASMEVLSHYTSTVADLWLSSDPADIDGSRPRAPKRMQTPRLECAFGRFTIGSYGRDCELLAVHDQMLLLGPTLEFNQPDEDPDTFVVTKEDLEARAFELFTRRPKTGSVGIQPVDFGMATVFRRRRTGEVGAPMSITLGGFDLAGQPVDQEVRDATRRVFSDKLGNALPVRYQKLI